MRILHVVPTVDASAGGPPQVASRLAAAQSGLGHQATLIAPSPREPSTAISVRLGEVPHGELVRWVDAGPATGLERVLARRGREALGRALKDADLCVIHCIWDAFTTAAAKEARARGVPYVVVPHGMLDPWCLRQKALKKRLALATYMRGVLNGATFLHALNASERDLMRPLGLSVPVEVIPNGVFLEEFENLPRAGAFRSSRPTLKNDPYILFLSRLHYKKGLDYLADAFAIVAKERADLRLVVAGSDDGYKDEFERMIAGHGLGERTHLVGPVYGDDKLAAFNDAACFCLPSRQEGFSIAVTESLACGTPAVVSEDCHYPEVSEVGAGAVTKLDAKAVAEGLRRVLAGDRGAMGEAGRRLVRERFNWPAVAKTTLEAYGRAYARLGRAMPAGA